MKGLVFCVVVLIATLLVASAAEAKTRKTYDNDLMALQSAIAFPEVQADALVPCVEVMNYYLHNDLARSADNILIRTENQTAVVCYACSGVHAFDAVRPGTDYGQPYDYSTQLNNDQTDNEVKAANGKFRHAYWRRC